MEAESDAISVTMSNASCLTNCLVLLLSAAVVYSIIMQDKVPALGDTNAKLVTQ
jgi:hypothetical protein